MEIIGSAEQFATWSKHFNAVKGKIVQPKKGHEVKVKTKNGQTYTFKYVNLADIDKAVEEAVKKVVDKDGNPYINYTVDATIDIDGISAETIVIDSCGCAVKLSKIWFNAANTGKAQEYGALVSYAKRYSLAAAFGIANEDEDDSTQQLMQARQQPQPRLLSGTELKEFKVSYSGRLVKLADLMDEAVNGDKDAQAAIKAETDPQAIIAIQQLSKIFKAKELKEEQKPKDKIDEAIKQIVDGDDPLAGLR